MTKRRVAWRRLFVIFLIVISIGWVNAWSFGVRAAVGVDFTLVAFVCLAAIVSGELDI